MIVIGGGTLVFLFFMFGAWQGSKDLLQGLGKE